METGAIPDGAPLSMIDLEFFVSADQEYWEMVVRCQGRVTHLRGRAFVYVLLLLARRRAEESATLSERPPSSVGWVDTERLLRDLGDGYTRDMLNSRIHEARSLFTAQGIACARDIIERRPNDTLRIGPVRFVERTI